MLSKGSRLARRRFSFLLGGPGAQASCCLLMTLQRPPDLTAGLLGKVQSPICTVLVVSWLKTIFQACEETYLSNLCLSKICGICWINLTNICGAKWLASLKKKKKRQVFQCCHSTLS